MGRNFISGCHQCKERQWYSEGEEGQGMHGFYRRHERCMSLDPKNVVTLCDQLQSEDWMWGDGGYIDISEGQEQVNVVINIQKGDTSTLKQLIEDAVQDALRKHTLPGGRLYGR